MRAHGAYYNLIKQQNSSHPEEQNDNYLLPEIILSNRRDSENKKARRSSIISFTSSLLNAFYKKKNSIDTEKQIDKSDIIKKSNVTWEIFKINKPEWLFIVIGCLAALINGALEPTSAIVQTKLVTVKRGLIELKRRKFVFERLFKHVIKIINNDKFLSVLIYILVLDSAV